uniref:Uncharacterized protein n=1 Tax=Sphaerodactylus townsendi TaxID=933632 RepID=A0ACB8GDL3_9SAUR
MCINYIIDYTVGKCLCISGEKVLTDSPAAIFSQFQLISIGVKPRNESQHVVKLNFLLSSFCKSLTEANGNCKKTPSRLVNCSLQDSSESPSLIFVAVMLHNSWFPPKYLISITREHKSSEMSYFLH